MESGPHKHAIQQTFFLYTWEPGGNRDRGLLGRLPDLRARTTSRSSGRRPSARRGRRGACRRSRAFHIKGTPPVPEEDALLAARRPLSRRARARELVRGAYDLHVHVEPDLAKRRIDDLGLARRFAELGLAGFVLKSHYAPTAERAAVVRARRAGRRRARRDHAQRRRRRAERAGGRDRGARRRADRLAADGRLRERGERGRARSRRSSRSGGRSRTSSRRPASASGPVRLTSERARAGARRRRAPRSRARDGAPRPRRDPRRRRRGARRRRLAASS